MWSDNETPDDLVGFRVHADLLRELIVDPTVLPVTIGVFGDWGGGKSSIMQMLKADFEVRAKTGGLDNKPYEGTAVLYFNGWLFEGYDDAKSAILTSVLPDKPKTFVRAGLNIFSADPRDHAVYALATTLPSAAFS